MKLKLLGKIRDVEVFGLYINGESNLKNFDFVDLYECNPEMFTIDKYGDAAYRAVSYEKWQTIKSTGVDVTPTDSVIYCDSLDKASEYGEWPKVIMGFDWSGLDVTYREVDSNIEPVKLQKLQEIYPTIEKSVDGAKYWLSRLAESDPRRTTAYETNYARWLPNDPWESLKVLILADLNDRDWVL